MIINLFIVIHCYSLQAYYRIFSTNLVNLFIYRNLYQLLCEKNVLSKQVHINYIKCPQTINEICILSKTGGWFQVCMHSLWFTKTVFIYKQNKWISTYWRYWKHSTKQTKFRVIFVFEACCAVISQLQQELAIAAHIFRTKSYHIFLIRCLLSLILYISANFIYIYIYIYIYICVCMCVVCVCVCVCVCVNMCWNIYN